MFRRLAVFSPDLLTRDGERLYDLVKEQIEQAFPSTATSAEHEDTVRLPEFAALPLFPV